MDELLSTENQASRQILDALGVAVYATDAEGVITYYNQAACELWGRIPKIGVDLWCGSWRIIRPDGSVLPHDQCPMAVAVKEDRPVRGEEAIAERPDGSRVWFAPFPTPLHDASGQLTGAVNVLLDITSRKQAEESLRESEQELSDFFENGVVPLHWVGPDGTILRANKAELALLGYEEHEYVGHNIAEFHPQAEVIEDILKRLGQGEVLQDYEAKLRCKDGSIKHVLIDSSVMWRDGKFVHTRCFTRDVTERKQAALRLQALVESSEDAIISEDMSGIITSWNSAAERMYGYTAEEAIGQSIRLIIPPDRQHEEDEVLTRIAKGERIEHFETARRRKDGTLVDISLSVSPVKDSTGRILGASKIARDVTERKAAEAAVRSSELRFRTLTALAPVGIFLTDPAGDCVMVNERWQEFAGLTEEQARGQGWVQALHPDDRERVFAEWYSAAERGEEFASEYRFTTPQGRVTWLSGTAKRLPGPNGEVVGYIGTVTDITHLKETERLKDQFLSLVSHELRTPLSTIYGSTRLLETRFDRIPDHDKKALIHDLVSETGRLQRIIENLLLLTKLDSAGVELEPISMPRVVEKAVASFHERHPKREVLILADTDIAPALANETYVELVLDNLLGNAAKYSSPEALIEVALSVSEDIEVRVLDRGIGITPEDEHKLFTAFYRSRAARAWASGVGVGLAVCKRVIDAQGGTIWARAREGGGAEFGFSLKALIAPEAEP